jgi:hypothetical protein
VVVQQPMTSTDVLVAGVIAVLLVPAARLYVILTAFGVVIVCVAFATTAEVMIATTLARSMAAHREDFWVRMIRVFILRGFLPSFFPRWLDSEIAGPEEAKNHSGGEVLRLIRIRLATLFCEKSCQLVKANRFLEISNDYAKFYSRSHDAVIRVYDKAGNLIETHEHKGEFGEW